MLDCENFGVIIYKRVSSSMHEPMAFRTITFAFIEPYYFNAQMKW